MQPDTWYKSLRVWGSVVSLICIVLANFGINIPDATQTKIIELLVSIGSIGGAILPIVSKIKETVKHKNASTTTSSGVRG